MNLADNAFIHPKARLGTNVTVSPFCYIDQDVVIGDNSVIEPHVTIYHGTTIGNGAHIFPGAVIGAIPQDLKFDGEKTYVEIGDNVIIRECCTINRATQHSIVTRIGSDVLLMAYVHVAHDCQLGDHVILSNAVNLAGHVSVEDHAILGGMVAVHQFVKIGAYSMVGGGSLVRKDVPPYILASREPLSYLGINKVGLKRKGFTSEQVDLLKLIYQIVFEENNNVKSAMEKINANFEESKERQAVIDFIFNSERGIIRGPNISA